jgi:hypothetical protein
MISVVFLFLFVCLFVCLFLMYSGNFLKTYTCTFFCMFLTQVFVFRNIHVSLIYWNIYSLQQRSLTELLHMYICLSLFIEYRN